MQEATEKYNIQFSGIDLNGFFLICCHFTIFYSL